MAQESTANRVYENYQPPYRWVQDEESKTLILMLPGYISNQLKVLVTSNHMIMIRGEQRIVENKWRRFSQEFSPDSDVDTNEIDAKLEGGLLYVKLPKVNKPQEPAPQVQEPKSQELPKADAPPTPKPDRPKAPQEASPSKPKADKEESEAKADEIAQKKKEQNDAEEKSKMEADANKEAQEKKKKSPNEFRQEAKATAPEAQEKRETVGGWGQGEAKVDQRFPTRDLRLGSTTQQYREPLVGLIVVVKKQSKLTNLIVAMLLVLVLGLYVKNAIKSYSGGAKIQEL